MNELNNHNSRAHARRFNPRDSIPTTLTKFSEGNPGALQVLAEIVFDPDPAAYGCLLMADMLGLYGSRLYMLWNDCLDRDTKKLIQLAELWREHKISDQDIIAHVDTGEGRGRPFNDMQEVLI